MDKLDVERLCRCSKRLVTLRDAYTTVMRGTIRVPVCTRECYTRWVREHAQTHPMRPAPSDEDEGK